MMLWKALSALGGVAVTGPLGVLVAVWLLAGRNWRLSFNWCLLYGGGLVAVVATKVLYYGWGIGIPEWQFAGLSGHAMRACAVYPVAFYVAFRTAQPATRHAALAAGVLLAVLISVSRVPVHAHSVSEAVLGAIVGFAVAIGFLVLARSERPAHVGRILLALCVPILAAIPFTKPLPTERWMRQVAMYMTGNQPVERAWRTGPDYQRFRREQEDPAI